MPNLLKRFEHAIVQALIVMMMGIVLLSTIELGWLLVQDIISAPFGMIEINKLLEIFGFFMLVLIGLELLETIRAYQIEHSVHAEIVIRVSMIAIARKIIILDVYNLSSHTLLGIAAIVLSLSAAFFVIYRKKAPIQSEKATRDSLKRTGNKPDGE